jgi:hypothetical protein
MTNPIIDKNGIQKWYNEKRQYHRINGPAIIHVNGDQVWYVDGELHRTDGPAYISINGYTVWYVNGRCYHDNKSFQESAKLNDEDMIAIVLKYGDVK